MQKVMFAVLWVSGLFMLVYLLQYPVQTEPAWENWSLPLSGKVIVLDPGHGGPDGGAINADGDILEKDVALQTSEILRDYLQQAGALVYMTREKDQDLADEGTKGLSRRKSEDIRKRVQFIKDKDPDFFISIHLNAIPSSRWHGAQTFYYPALEKSEKLAKLIQAEIRRNLNNTKREALAVNGIYILKHADRPGVLVEIGFLSNPHEADLLKSIDYQHKMAASIYEGILRYVTEDLEEKGA
ncbi:MAG: N-acetylmuramoyl-L-alanine amidase CwlD [Bacillaceae bacterium]|nr:N-acetylmuramoyl-L-alanine amidase CwlD [Bacillaceae bacterium]